MMHLTPTVVGVPKETSLLGLLLMLPVGGADLPMVIDWSKLSQEATGRSDSLPHNSSLPDDGMPVTQVVRLFAPGAIHRLATPDPTAASPAARFLLRHAGMGIVS